MKIALVSPYDFDHPGGVTSHVAHLAAALRSCGHDARVLAPASGGSAAREGVVGLTTSVVTISSGGARARVSFDPRIVGRARRLLKDERFDVVHLHNPLAPLVSLSFLAQRAAAPQTAFVATFHEFRDTPNPLIEAGRPVFRRLIARLDRRIAVSSAALAFNQAAFPGEFSVVPNGVDVARFSAAGREPGGGAAGRPPTVLFVGRLEPRKGLPHLLEAFVDVRRAVPDARLLVVGPFDMRGCAALLERSGAAGLPGIELVGHVSDDELPSYYGRADVFCAPSIDFESFGIVLLEAMAAGAAIVASDIPGYRTVVRDGQDALLVEPGRPARLAEAIVALLGNPARREALRAAGRMTAQSYDWSVVTGQVLEQYRAAIYTAIPRATN